MSAAQAIASSRFLNAMGSMIEDEQKMNRVLNYIVSLREDGAPCQFSTEEIIAFANKAEREYAEGLGMISHSDFMQEVASLGLGRPPKSASTYPDSGGSRNN